MVNLDRTSLIDSSARLGRWEISTVSSMSLRARYLTRSEKAGPVRPRPCCLLRVELDDELLLDLGVDDLPRRQAVHQDLELARDELEPRGDGLAAREALCDLEVG